MKCNVSIPNFNRFVKQQLHINYYKKIIYQKEYLKFFEQLFLV